jgi:hypothetical protein
MATATSHPPATTIPITPHHPVALVSWQQLWRHEDLPADRIYVVGADAASLPPRAAPNEGLYRLPHFPLEERGNGGGGGSSSSNNPREAERARLLQDEKVRCARVD